jgi:hypothetical protein
MPTNKNNEMILAQLEDAYNNISELLEKINSLNDLTKSIETVTNNFLVQYKQLLNTEQLKNMYDENLDAVKKIEENASKVTTTIKNLTYYKDLINNETEGFSKRFLAFEDELKKVKVSISDVDKKLSGIINETEKRIRRNNHDVDRTLKLLEVTAELTKYDELSKKVLENNCLLKEIEKSINASNNNAYNKRNNNNDVLNRVRKTQK